MGVVVHRTGGDRGMHNGWGPGAHSLVNRCKGWAEARGLPNEVKADLNIKEVYIDGIGLYNLCPRPQAHTLYPYSMPL